jgi:hypothetical protein
MESRVCPLSRDLIRLASATEIKGRRLIEGLPPPLIPEILGARVSD